MNFPACSFSRSCARALSLSRKDTHLFLGPCSDLPYLTVQIQTRNGSFSRSDSLFLSLLQRHTHTVTQTNPNNEWRVRVSQLELERDCPQKSWALGRSWAPRAAPVCSVDRSLFRYLEVSFQLFMERKLHENLKTDLSRVEPLSVCSSSCFSMLQWVALWCSTFELLCVVHHSVFAVICSVTRHTQPLCKELLCVAVCYSVLQYAWAHSSPCVRVDY